MMKNFLRNFFVIFLVIMAFLVILLGPLWVLNLFFSEPVAVAIYGVWLIAIFSGVISYLTVYRI